MLSTSLWSLVSNLLLSTVSNYASLGYNQSKFFALTPEVCVAFHALLTSKLSILLFRAILFLKALRASTERGVGEADRTPVATIVLEILPEDIVVVSCVCSCKFSRLVLRLRFSFWLER